MEVFIHGADQTKRHTIEPSARIADLSGTNHFVFAQDADEPLDSEKTLAEVGIGAGSHVHVATCRRVESRVRYGGDAKTEAFPPGATFARVFKWAISKKGFALTEAEAAKHTLRICGGTIEPDRADHIGQYSDAACEVCLDLVPKERFEG